MRPEVKNTSDSDLESVYSIEEPKICGKQPEPKKYICSFEGCGQAFRRMVHLDRHEYKHSGIRKHACIHEGCSKTYTNITHLKRHMKVFHEKTELVKDVKCGFDFCPKMFASTYSMQRHIREVHHNPKVYKCSHCDEKFTQKLKLRRHEVKHSGVYPYNCSKCLKGFVQDYFLQRHVCKTYECDQCKQNFEKWSQLMAHRKEANHKKLLKCEHCDKVFVSKYQLTEHEGTHEEDKEVFKCTEDGCPKFYSYKRNLTQHILSAHEGRKFSCSVEGCKVEFTTKKARDSHVKVVHAEKKTPTTPKIKKQRLKRKDAGIRKQSTLSKLSGVIVEKDVDKMIMEGTAEIEIDLPAVEEEVESESRTDTDDVAQDRLVELSLKQILS